MTQPQENKPMPARAPNPSEAPRGQILVIVAGALVAMLALTGVVVDGGYAWGQQRNAQNAADAAAEAGAVVMAQRLTGIPETDGSIAAAVTASLTANGVVNDGAWYTDLAGNLVDITGATVGSTAAAADVGGGTIPPNASGVRADSAHTFDTFLAGVIGFHTLTAHASATAVAGYIETVCMAEAGCDVMPVTIPLNVVNCDGTGGAVPSNPVSLWPYFYKHVTIPLCKNNPGNVGWLDWTPTAGGTSELEEQIIHPGNPGIDIPSWQYVTDTGNINSAKIEDALNYYAINKIPVLIPMFDSTCNTEPSTPSPGVPDVERCPAANVGGNGQNQWYHVARFVGFLFDDPKGAYLNGTNNADCEQNGNGAISCLKGQFVRFVTFGRVGPGLGSQGVNSAVGIQLIK